MKKMIQMFCWTLALLFCVACGKDNNQNKENAAVPQPKNQCVQNGGMGCSWNTYPPGYTAYPTANNGYYSGYSPYTGYSNYNACPMGATPIYDGNWGLACVYLGNTQSYYRQQWGGQNYGYLMNCNPQYPQTCPTGVCIPTGQINNPHYGWGYQQYNSQYSSFGICQQ